MVPAETSAQVCGGVFASGNVRLIDTGCVRHQLFLHAAKPVFVQTSLEEPPKKTAVYDSHRPTATGNGTAMGECYTYRRIQNEIPRSFLEAWPEVDMNVMSFNVLQYQSPDDQFSSIPKLLTVGLMNLAKSYIQVSCGASNEKVCHVRNTLLIDMR